jgi:hypothetical protein
VKTREYKIDKFHQTLTLVFESTLATRYLAENTINHYHTDMTQILPSARAFSDRLTGLKSCFEPYFSNWAEIFGPG